MRTIWKYQLDLTDRQVLRVPEGFNAASVQLQGGAICLWAEVDTDRPFIDVVIHIVGTGRAKPPDAFLVYIGTIQMLPFVWHIYEELPEEEDILPDGGDLA